VRLPVGQQGADDAPRVTWTPRSHVLAIVIVVNAIVTVVVAIGLLSDFR
jgi:preprotein translocase subunit SecE